MNIFSRAHKALSNEDLLFAQRVNIAHHINSEETTKIITNCRDSIEAIKADAMQALLKIIEEKK